MQKWRVKKVQSLAPDHSDTVNEERANDLIAEALSPDHTQWLLSKALKEIRLRKILAAFQLHSK
jgi:hypothetical protein